MDGFSRAPRKADLEGVRRALDTAVEQAKATVRPVGFAAGVPSVLVVRIAREAVSPGS